MTTKPCACRHLQSLWKIKWNRLANQSEKKKSKHTCTVNNDLATCIAKNMRNTFSISIIWWYYYFYNMEESWMIIRIYSSLIFLPFASILFNYEFYNYRDILLAPDLWFIDISYVEIISYKFFYLSWSTDIK